jgi:hypothetical protein
MANGNSNIAIWMADLKMGLHQLQGLIVPSRGSVSSLTIAEYRIERLAQRPWLRANDRPQVLDRVAWKGGLGWSSF